MVREVAARVAIWGGAWVVLVVYILAAVRWPWLWLAPPILVAAAALTFAFQQSGHCHREGGPYDGR